jgi:hypothetical protein
VRLWTGEGRSDYLVVPVNTLPQWNHKGGRLRPVRVDRHVRYREEDVQSWLDLQSVAACPPVSLQSAGVRTRRVSS